MDRYTVKFFIISSSQNGQFLLDQVLQYCAKVMQTIIDEYRDNRDLSAIFER